MGKLRRFEQDKSCIFSDTLSNLSDLEGRGFGFNGTVSIENKFPQPAVKLDGLNDYISFESQELVLGDCTVCCWLEVENFDQAGGFKFERNLISSATSVSRFFVASESFRVETDTNGQVFRVNATNNIDELMFICFARDGDTLTMYKNGEDIGSDTISSANVVTINKISSDGNRSWSGFLFNLIIFNRALSPQEILKMYNGSLWDYEKDLISKWDFSSIDSLTTDDVADVGWREFNNIGQSVNMSSSDIIDTHVGKGVVFDNTPKYININNSDSLQFNNDSLSCSFWMKATAFSGGGFSLSYLIEKLAGGFYIKLKDTSELQVDLIDSGANQLAAAVDFSAGIELNKWYHIILSIDRSIEEIRLFSNGELVGSHDFSGDSLGTLNGSADLKFGGTPSGSTDYFNGSLSNIKFYKTAFTKLEAIDLMRKDLQKRDNNNSS